MSASAKEESSAYSLRKVPAEMYWFCRKSRQACNARGVPDIGVGAPPTVVVSLTLPPTFCGRPLTNLILSNGIVQRPSAALAVSVTTHPGGGTIGIGRNADMVTSC